MLQVDVFYDHFQSRLAALGERETHTFPRELLPERHRSAAVLLPFWPGADSRVQVVFTRRTAHLPSHAGQVSFPGGARHAEDPSLERTALRETWEELGIEPERVRVMGRLDDAWSIAGHHVVPFVGWLDEPPPLRPNPAEVDEVIVADVETLLDPACACEHRVEHNGVTRITGAFRWDGGYVWGLTADILLEFLLWVDGKPSNRAGERMRRMQSLLHRSG